MVRKGTILALLLMNYVIGVRAQQPSIASTSQTIINGRAITRTQKLQFQLIYGRAPLPGNFWYDSRSGMWGFMGHQVAGVLTPGLALGPLSPRASNGDSGVFLNGRELTASELMLFQQLVGGPIGQCRAWLDGRTGNFGLEGFPIPLGNLSTHVQSSDGVNRNADGSWSYKNFYSDNSVISDGNSIFFTR
jgi:hypothetical protein